MDLQQLDLGTLLCICLAPQRHTLERPRVPLTDHGICHNVNGEQGVRWPLPILFPASPILPSTVVARISASGVFSRSLVGAAARPEVHCGLQEMMNVVQMSSPQEGSAICSLFLVCNPN